MDPASGPDTAAFPAVERTTDDIQIHYDGGWAAVYVNGELYDAPGDSYRQEEIAFDLLKVKQVHDNAWLRGGDGMDRGDGRTVARTLAEVETYRRERLAAAQKADELEAEAKRLLKQAKDLRTS